MERNGGSTTTTAAQVCIPFSGVPEAAIRELADKPDSIQEVADGKQACQLSPAACGGQVQQHGSHVGDPVRESLVEITGVQLNAAGLRSPVRSLRKRRSARAASNLRKSLAWDTAFSTEEGVLDVDELPLADKTPKKLVEVHPIDIPMTLVKSFPLPTVDLNQSITSGETAVPDAVKTLSRETPLKVASPAIATYLETTESELNISRPVTANRVIQAAMQSVSGSPRTVPVNSITKVDVCKGTRLRLPRTLAGKSGECEEIPYHLSNTQNNLLHRCKSTSSLPNPSSSRSTLSKKVSSVSKKVKHTLGKVLPGSFGGSVANHKNRVEQGLSGGHQSSALKTLQTSPTSLGRTLNFIGKVLNSSPGPSSIARSKSARLLSGSNMGAAEDIKKTSGWAEMGNQEANSIHFGEIMGPPNSKFSSSHERQGLSGSTNPKSGSASREGSQRPSYSSTKGTSEVSKKRTVAEDQREASDVSVEKIYAESTAQSNAVYSSGLRLPSPKIGFFDTMRPSTLQEASSLPERVLGTATDGSARPCSRKDLPPRPQQRLPSGPTVQACSDKVLTLASTRLGDSGIPTAPHLRAPGKKGRVSAPTSPQVHSYKLRSPASSSALSGRCLSFTINSGHVHSSINEPENNTSSKVTSRTFRNLLPGSNAGGCDHSFDVVESRGVCTISKVIEVRSVPNAHETNEKYRGLAADRTLTPDELANQVNFRFRRNLEGTSKVGVPEKDLSNCVSGPQKLPSHLSAQARKAVGAGDQDTGLLLTSPGGGPSVDDVRMQGNLDILVCGKGIGFGKQEPSISVPSHIPDICEKKSVSDTICPSQEQVQELSKCLRVRLQKKDDENKVAQRATSLGQDSSSPITPAFKIHSDPKAATRDSVQQGHAECSDRSTSPVAGFGGDSGRSPLGLNLEILNSVDPESSRTSSSKKERKFMFMFARSASEKRSGQENKRGPGQVENAYLCKPKQRTTSSSQKLDQSEAIRAVELSCPFSEAELRALDAAEQESLQKKSGAVQHSPPNKSSPSLNPWSPVKRNGQQLGPFDCTKKYSNGIMKH